MAGEGKPEEAPAPKKLEPTAGDRENERRRQAIAERMEAEYRECYLKAFGAFGPGWLPSCRHYLVDKDVEDRHRRDGSPMIAAATVFTVKNAEGRKRHFTVGEDGLVTECASMEAGFGGP